MKSIQDVQTLTFHILQMLFGRKNNGTPFKKHSSKMISLHIHLQRMFFNVSETVQ